MVLTPQGLYQGGIYKNRLITPGTTLFEVPFPTIIVAKCILLFPFFCVEHFRNTVGNSLETLLSKVLYTSVSFHISQQLRHESQKKKIPAQINNSSSQCKNVFLS